MRALAGLDLPALRAAWRERWGDPPRYRSRDLMLRAAAHRAQAEVFGGLAAAVRGRMARYAVKFTADRAFTPAPGPSLKPGSSLIREWRGVRHEVVVTAVGFAYLGEGAVKAKDFTTFYLSLSH